MSKTATQAIAESIATNSIIHLIENEVTQDDLDTLLVEADNSTETQHGVEFWGEGWRVHVDHAE